MGIRSEHGFIGDRDRETQEPIPDHISAKYEDLEQLMAGWLQTQKELVKSRMDPVLVAAKIAFGFVFIWVALIFLGTDLVKSNRSIDNSGA